MNVKIISMIAALAVAVPLAAEAAPAGGLTAQAASSVAIAPAVDAAAVAPGENNAKVEKVWWRGGYGWRGGCCWRGGWGGWRGYGWRGYGWRGYGWRGYGWGWHRGWGWRRW